MKTIGNPDHFAFEIGDYQDGGDILRHVDIWVGGIRLCSDDSCAHVGQFTNDLKREIEGDYRISRFAKYIRHLKPVEMAAFVVSTREEESPNYDLEDDTIFPCYGFLDLGPTTDHLSSFLFSENRKAFFVYSFWREALSKGEPESYEVLELDYEEVMAISRHAMNYLIDT